ncbi:MAG: NB-ARC domain-containing protein [Kibdelosporangium sp.]
MDEVGERPSAFGGLLLGHRRAAGLTQEALSAASGISVRALRDLERGRAHAAQHRSAQILADALRLTGDQRQQFLDAAREGRRRAPRSSTVTALSKLPVALPDLVGRDEELTRLRTMAAGNGTVAIVGHPGVGKTALAIYAAHHLRDEFPDGRFAVDLRGMDEQPMSTRSALHRLLRALAVPESEIPVAEADQAALYRAVLTGRRVLVLLDNAADEAQVRPLLAGTPGCLTLVTCRRTLAGLEAVRWLWLEPVAGHAAVELLTTIAGPQRVLAEPAEAAELAALCGHLPLAVRIAGERLASRPHWSLSYLVEQLRDERTRLSSLAVGNVQVRQVFEMSYRRLPPAARMVLRRLAVVPGSDFGVELTEAATGLRDRQAYRFLDEFADASLLQATPVEGRFQFHDLIRIFVRERWEAEEEPAERERLTTAVLDHLLDTARFAGEMFFPDSPSPAGRFPSSDEAGEWLDREESNWLAALREVARLARHRQVLRLVAAMHWYSDSRWAGMPWDEVFRLGLDAARGLGDRPAEAKMLNFRGWAQTWCLGDRETALATHHEALAVALAADDRAEQAWAHAYIGSILMELGSLPDALQHTLQAQALSDGFGFWAMQIAIRYRLGRILLALERSEEALTTLRGLLADAERLQGDGASTTRRSMVAIVRNGVASCLYAMGEWRAAAEMFAAIQQVFVDAGSPGSAADAAVDEGKAWLAAGEHGRARECLRSALSAYRELGLAEQQAQVVAELDRLPAQ